MLFSFYSNERMFLVQQTGIVKLYMSNLSGILLLRTFRITCIVSTCTSEGDIVLLTMSKVRGCHLQESTLALTKAHWMATWKGVAAAASLQSGGIAVWCFFLTLLWFLVAISLCWLFSWTWRRETRNCDDFMIRCIRYDHSFEQQP